jgi:Flp pilus assembly protein TadB
MSSPEPSSSTTEPDDNVHPFREPAFVIFAYTAWAAGSWFVGPLAGLAALVVAAVILFAAGVRAGHAKGVATFTADLALILLYCCAAIGTGVLVVAALT